MKLGIIIDSSAGLTQKQTEDRGWGFLPLYLSIDGKEYADGIDITAKEYYKMIDISMDVKTSSTPPGIIMDVFKKMSKEFDHIIVYPLSTELSSQVNNLVTFSKEFENIHVIESYGIGSAMINDCEILEKMAKDDIDIDEIIELGNKITREQTGMLVPKHMQWLVKGGRISPKIASMANMLKIVPMLEYANGKLEKFGKGRVFNKTIQKAAQAVIDKSKNKNVQFTIYNGGNEDIHEIKLKIEELIGHPLNVELLTPVIGNHIGPGFVALMSHRRA